MDTKQIRKWRLLSCNNGLRGFPKHLSFLPEGEGFQSVPSRTQQPSAVNKQSQWVSQTTTSFRQTAKTHRENWEHLKQGNGLMMKHLHRSMFRTPSGCCCANMQKLFEKDADTSTNFYLPVIFIQALSQRFFRSSILCHISSDFFVLDEATSCTKASIISCSFLNICSTACNSSTNLV